MSFRTKNALIFCAVKTENECRIFHTFNNIINMSVWIPPGVISIIIDFSAFVNSKTLEIRWFHVKCISLADRFTVC